MVYYCPSDRINDIRIKNKDVSDVCIYLGGRLRTDSAQKLLQLTINHLSTINKNMIRRLKHESSQYLIILFRVNKVFTFYRITMVIFGGYNHSPKEHELKKRSKCNIECPDDQVIPSKLMMTVTLWWSSAHYSQQ